MGDQGTRMIPVYAMMLELTAKRAKKLDAQLSPESRAVIAERLRQAVQAVDHAMDAAEAYEANKPTVITLSSQPMPGPGRIGTIIDEVA